MGRSLMRSKAMQAILLLVVLVAVWKATGGNVDKIIDGFIAIIDRASDILLQAWRHIFG